MGRAGGNIRAMAWNYRWQGAGSWALAAACVGATIGLPILLKFSLAVPLYLVGLGAGVVLFFRGSMLFRQAARAYQGAKGEELKTKQAKVRNKGMGSAVVNVSDQLDASVSKEDLQRLTMSLRREDV